MNIACAVVITVVVVAMVVATIVYFCVNKTTNGGGYQAKTPLTTAMPTVQMAQQPKATVPSALVQHSTPQMGPAQDGILFPKLSAQDTAELGKSHQLAAVKNYASGQKNAILNDMKYTQVYDKPPIFKNADFFPYRGKEDELMYQLQTAQAKKFEDQFNQSDDYWTLREKNIRPEFT